MRDVKEILARVPTPCAGLIAIPVEEWAALKEAWRGEREAGRQEEREACARLAETAFQMKGYAPDFRTAGDLLAFSIRHRGGRMPPESFPTPTTPPTPPRCGRGWTAASGDPLCPRDFLGYCGATSLSRSGEETERHSCSVSPTTRTT